MIGLGFSPFARHYLGNHFCFLFLRLLRCFSSTGAPPHSIKNENNMGLPYCVSAFGNLRINICLSTPRSLSQTTTSFFAGFSLGIHHMLCCIATYYMTNILQRLIMQYITLDFVTHLRMRDSWINCQSIKTFASSSSKDFSGKRFTKRGSNDLRVLPMQRPVLPFPFW